MKILVLFGNKNFYDGSLSAVAKSRCDEAIEFLRGEKDFFVLPTGAFGAHFNMTHIAHGQYLTKYLDDSDVKKERILLPYTNSSNTVEDVLCVRKLAIDHNASEVRMLTSDFHMKRVKYISERLFHDISKNIKVSFQEAQTPWGKIDPLDHWQIKAHECRSLEKLQREWVDVPLYTLNACLPNEIFENASNEHKHYDNLSLVVVSAIAFVFAFPHVSEIHSLGPLGLPLALLTSSSMILCLFFMYLRMMDTASAARRVMHQIEVGFGQPGFYTSYQKQHFRRKFISIRELVLLLSFLAFVFNMVSAAYILDDVRESTRLECLAGQNCPLVIRS